MSFAICTTFELLNQERETSETNNDVRTPEPLCQQALEAGYHFHGCRRKDNTKLAIRNGTTIVPSVYWIAVEHFTDHLHQQPNLKFDLTTQLAIPIRFLMNSHLAQVD